ncbi:MAG: glycosyltransferase family 4 protein [Dehalococcoidales bacterium]|nr:glycosyltransferase family 4 protein [Dehalococcoidales bacterium]
MKIGLVSAYDYPYPGGVSEHVHHLEEEFTRLGHAVKIIAPSSSDKEELARGNVYKVGSVVPIPANGSVARISLSLRLSGSVKRILRQEQFDVIHLHEPLLPALPVTVLRHSHALNVGTFHAYQNRSLAYFYGKRILKRFFNKLHGRIAVSQAAREFIGKYFPASYEVIPNGIDLRQFNENVEPLPEYNDGYLNILFVGRLEKRKGFQYLLKAFPYIKHEIPNARLIVAGGYGEEDKEQYESFAQRTGLADIVFAGFVPSELLPRYYKSSTLFCAPSTGGESFGIILLEAMATGKPIVASDIEGYRGLLQHGVEGLLVPPKDETALAVAIVRLLADRELREKMAEGGRRKALDYSWSKVARQVLKYYYDLGEQYGFSLSEDRARPAPFGATPFPSRLYPLHGE